MRESGVAATFLSCSSAPYMTNTLRAWREAQLEFEAERSTEPEANSSDYRSATSSEPVTSRWSRWLLGGVVVFIALGITGGLFAARILPLNHSTEASVKPQVETTKVPIITTVAPLPTIPSTTNALGSQENQLVRQLTIIRAAHNLTAPKWNETLAAQIQSFADLCPRDKIANATLPGADVRSFELCDSACMSTLGPMWNWFDDVLEYVQGHVKNQIPDVMTTRVGQVWFHLLSYQLVDFGCGFSTINHPCKNGTYIWCKYNLANNQTNVATPIVLNPFTLT